MLGNFYPILITNCQRRTNLPRPDFPRNYSNVFVNKLLRYENDSSFFCQVWDCYNLNRKLLAYDTDPPSADKIHIICTEAPPTLTLFSLIFPGSIENDFRNVTDESGNPVPDVSVIVQNTKTGTKTDANGHYSLQAAPGATVVFSSTNTETATVVIGNNNVYDIGLKLKVGGLSDVVVVGYGRQRKV